MSFHTQGCEERESNKRVLGGEKTEKYFLHHQEAYETWSRIDVSKLVNEDERRVDEGFTACL